MTIAVLDFGKTNSKLFVFDAGGRIVFTTRTRPVWHDVDGLSVLDAQALGAWAREALEAAEAARPNELLGVMVAAHGCTFALADEAGLIRPILNYEQELPGDLEDVVAADMPPYAETFAPPRPQGFNYGRHLLWLRHLQPEAFQRATAILGYPQYWSWRLGGRQVAEYTYMGCHSHIWAPARRDFASVVDAQGWRDKMPGFERAGAVIGETGVGGRRIAVHNGVHDSNAALHAYRSLGRDDVALISTGTWVIIFNPDCPLDALDPAIDMYCNVDVDGRPVPTIGFMGGREFDAIAGDWQEIVDRGAIQRVIAARQFVLPAFAAAGPFGGITGRIEPPISDPGERAAAAMLYVALMIDFCLEAIQSRAGVIIDGGLTTGGVLAELIAQLRPDQPVAEGVISEGTAAGAASLAFAAHGHDMELPQPVQVAASRYAGLDDYRREWRAQLPALGRGATRPAA
jgi:sugar (pentulose or hexulose) kinase